MTQLEALREVFIYIVGGVFSFGILWALFKLLTGHKNSEPDDAASLPTITLPRSGNSEARREADDPVSSGRVAYSDVEPHGRAFGAKASRG